MSGERILVVDDEPDVVRLCVEVLAEKGRRAHGAGSGREALACLEREQFDLLLVDIKMPDVDGLTVLRRARELDPNLTAVIITGHGTMQTAIDALWAGARGLLIKPFGLDDLMSAVDKALEERRREQENLLLRARLPILEISQALVAEGDVVFLARRLLEVVARQIGADRASLMLLDEEADELYIVEAVGLPAEGVEADLAPALRTRVPVEQSIAGQVAGHWRDLLQGEELLVLDGRADLAPSWRVLIGWPEIASVVCVPLRTRERAVGVLNLSRLSGSAAFAPSDLNLLSVVGVQIAIALDNARLYQAVAQAEREWTETFDAITDGISIHDVEFRIVRANCTLSEWLSVPAEELVGQNCYALFHQREEPPSFCPLAETMASGRPHTAEVEKPVLDGMFQTSTYPLIDGEGEVTGAVHIMQDITERKQMEKQLIQSEKLAALGRLAASLAHEINNPLQALRSGLGLLIKGSHKKEKRQQYLQVANREVERLIAITERMLNFYRPSAEQQKLTDVNGVLDEVLTLAGKKLQHSRVTLSRNLGRHLPPVEAVVDHLWQVFLNIFLNALDAMPEGGELTVTSGFNSQREEVWISFADTGEGIATEDMSRIFEPLYSTKPRGTGLGLAISYGIVERHNGRMEVQSEVGVGSTFTVFLPTEGFDSIRSQEIREEDGL